MDVKTIQQALRVAIRLDIENAKETFDMTLNEHADAFAKLAPFVAKTIVAIAKLNVDKIQAEMN